MREIVLDTETTGLHPTDGHRIVEIGCIELINHIPSDRHFHCYLNPERSMPSAAQDVHGLSEEFLADKPKFGEIVDAFQAFIRTAPVVIHNARFDIGFLNAELARLDRPPIPGSQAIDTVELARRKFPGAPANLDALCRRFDIDLSAREKHGALLDAELLAAVYLELIGGRQPGLKLTASFGRTVENDTTPAQLRPPRPHAPSDDEIAAHTAFVETLDSPIWYR